MRVNSHLYQANSPAPHLNRANQNPNRNSPAAGARGGRANRDTSSISRQGKIMNRIEELTKQKETIIESKNSLIRKTLESGGDIDTIKEQLDVYQERLEDIDKQIDGIYTQEAKLAAELAEKEKKPKKPDESKSAEQLETEHLSKLADVTESVHQAELISAVKSRVEGAVQHTESEIAAIDLHIDMLESRKLANENINVAPVIANEKRVAGAKEELAGELRDEALQLDVSHGKKLNEAISALEESEKPEDAKDAKDERGQTSPSAAPEPPSADAPQARQ